MPGACSSLPFQLHVSRLELACFPATLAPAAVPPPAPFLAATIVIAPGPRRVLANIRVRLPAAAFLVGVSNPRQTPLQCWTETLLCLLPRPHARSSPRPFHPVFPRGPPDVTDAILAIQPLIGPANYSSSAHRCATNPEAARRQATASVCRYQDSYGRLRFTPASSVTFRLCQTPYRKAEVLTVGPPTFSPICHARQCGSETRLTSLSLPHA
ncbi:hypothetical protein B0J12DRAFT_351068 [Macrophomina phaseolina]|uniref:Uncharacterized protein n=1 Tax=Macrophomina phaseolina TaxID=35725 RepID=A0ABQ8FUT1_9PEZI|nr:hypothetical protein B0J12DRAFT_351068 [Macrophomina phaseolina]